MIDQRKPSRVMYCCFLLVAMLFSSLPNAQGQYTISYDGFFDWQEQNEIFLELDSNQLSAALPIGFSFNYFGNTYTQFYISSNGFITFDPAAGSGPSAQTIPNVTNPNNLIALGWGSLQPDYLEFYYETIGTYPTRSLVVSIITENFGDGGNCDGFELLGQIVLKESTHRIEIHTDTWYGDECGVAVTQGIENGDGTIAFAVPGRNASLWQAFDQYVAFIPSSEILDMAVTTYSPTLCPGQHDIKVTIQNLSTVPVDSIYLDWTWEGVPQNALFVETTLAPLSSMLVTLGQKTIETSEQYDLEVWSYNPDNGVDAIITNDTLTGIVSAGLSGIKTIGGSMPDYATITDAINSLETTGVCDSVIFDIRPGTYVESLDIDYFYSSGAGTAIFRASSGNASDVIITMAYNSAGNNRLVDIDHVNELKFRDLTLKVTGTACSNVVYATGACEGLEITDCILRGSPCTSAVNTGATINMITGNKTSPKINNNIIKYGNYGINIEPGYPNYSQDLQIINNQIDSSYKYGIYLINPQQATIHDNAIFCPQSGASGLQMSGGSGDISISQNQINVPQGSQGLRVDGYQDGGGNDSLLIYNNMVSLGGSFTGGICASFFSSNKMLIRNNNFLSTSSLSTASCLSISNTPAWVENNVIANLGAGKAATFIIWTADYNSYYSVSTPLITNGSANYNSLAEWQSATGQDLHSIQGNPGFISSSNLHVTNTLLNGRGTPLSPPILIDFDEELRSPTDPDIGADEFGFLSDDIAVAELLFSNNLTNGTNEVSAVVTNIGINAVTSYSIGWKYNGTIIPPAIINTPIAASGSDTIVIGEFDMIAGVAYTIRAYSSAPNGNVDNDQTNDTISVGPVYPRMSGIFTVYGTTPDFPNVNAAILAAQQGGIVDSIGLAIRNGLYHDPILPSASNQFSCSKPIRIFSESGNPANVVFDNANLLGPVVRLNNVAGFHFENITFSLTASASHNVVIIENLATCNSFTGCIFNGRISTVTATTHAVVLCNSTQGINNDIIGCRFNNGSYSLHTTGPSSATNTQVDIRNNSFKNAYFAALNIVSSDGAVVSGNSDTITAPQNSGRDGLIANDCKNLIFQNNIVYHPFATDFGISVSDCDGLTGDTTFLFNNYSYLVAGIAFHVNITNRTVVKNNTVRNMNGIGAQFLSSSDFKIENNIFESKNSGVAIKLLNMSGSNIKSDNNCLHAVNTDVGELQSVRKHSLADWQTTGFDTLSIASDPLFNAATYHVKLAALDGEATHHYLISNDLDGDTRHATTPDIGADEFTPLPIDAGVLAIVNPKMPFPSGTNSVYVKFYNNGANILNSLQFNWTVNGETQPSFLWTGLLTKAEIYDSLEIGNYDFLPYSQYNIRIWVTQPNGTADVFHANDTIQILNQIPGLSGSYTIGGEAPDFETITAAVAALHAGGAADEVVFNIRNGVYAQPIALQDFPGSDCDRNVIFQPENGANVTITNLGINAHTIVLTGADGVHFKNLNLVSVNTAWRHVVLFSGGSHCNQFIDNVMTGFVSTATANTSAVIRSTTGHDTANVFTGNEIYEGSWAFHLTGNSAGPTNTRIENNHIETFYRGVFITGINDVTVKGNTILIDHATSRGIEIFASPMLKEISFNDIRLPLGQHGIYVDNCDNVTTQHGRIYNNFVSVGGTSTAIGLFVTGSNFQDILHNNVLVYSTNTTLANTIPCSLTSNPSTRLYNNAFKNAGPGYAISMSSNTSMLANRNAYFTAGSTFGFWNAGAVETTFALWKTNSGLDAQSINADPNFLSNTNLHTYLTLLNGTGEPNLGITVDIDGEIRDSVPDIGADEFDPLPLNDAGIFMYAGPSVPFAHGLRNVNLVLKNFGGNTLTSVQVRWTVNGIEQTPYQWTGTLPSTQCDTVTVGTYTFAQLTSYQIDAWTQMPNNTADAEPYNDLLATDPFYASLSGVYTVGGFAPDFNLVSDLETILQQAGIVGNVTFNFRPGTYTEALMINDFPRISYAHSVTFQSESGDSTDVILTQNTNNISLIDFDDAHRVTFKKLTLRNTKGNVCHIRNGSSLITLERNRLEGLESLASSRSLIYSPATTEDSITILNNVLQHGYYGIYLYGGDYEKQHIIQGNTFLGNFHYCAYLRQFDGLTLTGNFFNATSTGDKDLYMYSGTGACTITSNRIISDNSNAAVQLYTMTNVSANTTQFVNNYIYKSGTTSSDAVLIQSVSKINIDFNTIHNALTHPSSAALYTENLTTWNVRNNILYSHAGAAFHNSGALPAIHNYNAIFSLGPVVAQQNTTTYSSLSAYAAGTSTNANSKAVDPLFVTPQQPQISQYQLNGTGIAISGITTDISGATRTAPPDIGAKEFTPLMHDIKLSHIQNPQGGCGLEADETVTVVLVNQGTANATGFNVHFEFAGQTITENIGAQIVTAGDSLFYDFAQTIDASDFETYELESWHTYAADLNHANDSTSHNFTNNPPFTTAVSNMIPTSGTSNLENQVSLSWSPVDGAVAYDLYVWLSTGSKPVTPTHANLNIITKLVTGLNYGATYYWQVHAINICDEELESDTATFLTRVLPDLAVESIVIPATAFSEQVIGIEWVVKNNGLGNTVPGTWHDNIYLSPDPTYNSFDPLLGSITNLTSLPAGQSYTHSANVTLPQGTNGNYYIIIKTDHYNAVKETNNNNNTTYSTSLIQVILVPPPDLIVTNITTPTLTFSGQYVNISYEVRNNGEGITTDNIWKDEIALLPAPNTTGTTTILSTRTHTGHLEPDSSYIVTQQVGIPQNIFGDYQIRVITDNKNDVYEFASDGNNTTLSDVFEIVLTPPVDLVPDSLLTPDTISIYGTYPITYEVRNEGGSSPIIGWTDRYYLSQSPVYNTNFLTHLGYVYHNAGLMPGNENDKTIYLKIIGNYTGTYYLYMVTDYNNKISEYNFEGNNIVRSDPFVLIRPDLRPDSLIHPANAMSGSGISLRSEITNDGPGDYYGNLNTRIYLSDDAQLSTLTDRLLDSRTYNNLNLTTSDTITNTFNVGLPAEQFGAKYLLCQTDAAQWAFEQNENNNVLATPIQIFESAHPDLVPSSIITPATITAGVSFMIQYTLSNTGDRPVTTSVTDSIFLSFSPSWNRSTATPLGIRATSLLDTAQSVVFNVSLQTAFSQNPNQYYIYIVSDARGAIYEGSGEVNNILRSNLIVLNAYPEVDLKIHTITGIADTITSGQQLSISYTVQNLSTTETYYSQWSEKWYLSADSIFSSATDMLMTVFPYTAGKVNAIGTKSAMALLQVPHGITGDYYLFIETDALDLNNDNDRSNNINTVRIMGAAKKLHIRLAMYPDLAVADFVCPVEVTSGRYFDIITDVINDGNGIAGYRTDKIFVSPNNIIESGDLALATIVKGPLMPDQIQRDTQRVFVPANYTGNYFLIYSIDHGNQVYEYQSESNNILITSIIATPPPPADLIVANILVPDSVLAGDSAVIMWETENQGQNPASGQFREILYLSLDTIWQVTDEVLGTWDGFVSLNPGAQITKSIELPYNNVTNADYHTLVRTDAKNNINESNEENNDAYSYDLTDVDIEELQLEVIKSASLPQTINRYYKLEIGADEADLNVLVTLNSESIQGVNELYVKYGAVPTPADHDYAFSEPFSPNQQILIRDALPGFYYVLVRGFTPDTTAQEIEVLARIIRMEIIGLSPQQGGNKGYTTIEVFGSELDSLIAVKLVLNDTTEYYEILADTFFTLDGGTRVIARFNLNGQTLGMYHLRCRREGPWLATYQNGFEIIEGTGPDLNVKWNINPRSFNSRFNTLFQIKIDVENSGDADAENKFIRVGTPNSNNPVYYSLSDYYSGIQHLQLLLSAEDANGYPGVLRPGGRRTYYVYGRVGGTQGFSLSFDQ